MLVLSRKLDEAIWLGDNIKIKIMGIEKGVVKLGIDAPNEITILREELKEEVINSNIKASNSSADFGDLQDLMSGFKKS